MEQKADQQRSGGANAERGLAFEDEVYYHIRPPLTEECWSRIADADQLVIYSLEVKEPEPPGRPQLSDRQGDIEAPNLHGYPILSQVDVVDSETIGKVYLSLRAGAEEGTRGEKCFIPHHGVRAIHGQGTVDLIICFFCTSMLVIDSSESKPFKADISDKPMDLLEELLEAE